MMNKLLQHPIALVIMHFSVWLAFLSIPLFSHNAPFIDRFFFFKLLINTFFLASFFYANLYLLIPKLLARKHIFFYIISVIVIIIAISLIHLAIEYYFNRGMFQRHWFIEVRVRAAILSSILILLISGGYRITKEWLQNSRQIQEIEKEKLTSELLFLKNQVSPHFLFNTLNNIYSLTLKKSDDAPEALLKLAQLMRYMLYESNVKWIEIEKEVEYIHNYIALQHLRLDDSVKITFDNNITGNPMIEPMLLIPLVENAFKHGVSYRQESYIFITLKASATAIDFVVENNLFQQAHTAKDESSGIGLANIQRRLELLYPDNFLLSIDATEHKFKVHLRITSAKNNKGQAL